MMYTKNLLILGFALFLSIGAQAQCDSLLTLADPVNKDGLKLNSQSFVKDLHSTEDMELTLVLSQGRRYDFEIIGHREFEVFLVTGTSEEKELKTKGRKLVLNSEDEKDGIFTLKSERSQQLVIHFRGEDHGESTECTGVLIYSTSN